MARPTKKEINLSKESMLSLMQEIYNELVEQRSTAIRIQNKMLTMMKEPEDMAMIGPIIEKQQKIINDLDKISPYDYDIFDNQSLLRPYNGSVVKAVDFEMSRGCIYSCNYCVETIIQKYYDFNESSPKTGAIKNFKSYL
jgi:radical SAM superfamily enzyme YgiQ (UPF0313 family)